MDKKKYLEVAKIFFKNLVFMWLTVQMGLEKQFE